MCTSTGIWGLEINCYGIQRFKETKTTTKKELKRNNKITMDFILEVLLDSVKNKVGQCSSSKDIWDKLHNIYSKESLLIIIEPEHVDQNKEDVEIEWDEISASCQTDPEEEVENDK